MKPKMESITRSVALAAALLIVALRPCAAAVPNTTPIDLGAFPELGFSEASAINASGQVGGICYNSDGSIRKPFIWQNNVMTPLPLPEGCSQAMVAAINPSGKLAGTCLTKDGFQACLWQLIDKVWTLKLLGSPPSFNVPNPDGSSSGSVTFTNTIAYQVNDAGQVLCMTVCNEYPIYLPCVWKDGVWTFPLASNGLPFGAFRDMPPQMNEKGQVLFWIEDAEEGWGDLMLWEDTKVTRLVLKGESASLNNSGQVVGMFYDQTTGVNNFTYDASSATLNQSPVTDAGYYLKKINDNGQILVVYPTINMWDDAGHNIKKTDLGIVSFAGWTAAATVTRLATVPTSVDDSKSYFNANGEVSGYFALTPTDSYYASAVAGLVPLKGLVQNPTLELSGMNASGMIIGASSMSDGKTHAVLWTATLAPRCKTGTTLEIPASDQFSDALDINDASQAVGYSYDSDGANSNPLIWQNGVMSLLPFPTGSGEGVPSCINASGLIGGSCVVPPNGDTWYSPACLWTQKSGAWDVTVLGAPSPTVLDDAQDGYYSCWPVKIYSASQILAVAEKWDHTNNIYVNVGCVWDGASWTLLMDGNEPLSYPIAMSDKGQVLARKNDGHLVVWNNGIVTTIGVNADFVSMNRFGQVAGSSYENGGYVPFIYLPEAAYGLEAGLHTYPGAGTYLTINDVGMLVSSRILVRWNEDSGHYEVAGTELTTSYLNGELVYTCILPGELWAQPFINASGAVSGLLNTLGGNLAGFYVDPTGVALLSNENNAFGEEVTAISAAGQVVGRVSGRAVLWDTMPAGNHAPIADAGPDQTVQVSGTATTVTLSGTGSSDADGEALSYAWTENETTIATGPSPSFALTPGTHTITLTVTDPKGASSQDTVVINVFYAWSGVLQPIDPPNANGVSTSVFKAASTVSVRFALTGASFGITTLTATLTYAKVSNGLPGSDVEAVSNAAATAGNLFRYDSTTGQYTFNWSTKGLTSGTYRLFINLGDGVSHTVDIGLK